MGCCASAEPGYCTSTQIVCNPISETYTTLQALKQALVKAGCNEGVDLLWYIDATQSNQTQATFCSDPRHPRYDPLYRSPSLHDVGPAVPFAPPPEYQEKGGEVPSSSVPWLLKPPEACTPYEYAMQVVYQGVMHIFPLDKDRSFPLFYFGDSVTTAEHVRSFTADDDDVRGGLAEMLELYAHVMPRLHLSGPTSFAPALRHAVQYVQRNGPRSLHVMIVLCDGTVSASHLEATKQALTEASHYPLEVLVVGLGDGPFDAMHHLDMMHQRRFDNLRFVEFNDVRRRIRDLKLPPEREAEMCFLGLLQELPTAVRRMRELGLLA